MRCGQAHFCCIHIFKSESESDSATSTNTWSKNYSEVLFLLHYLLDSETQIERLSIKMVHVFTCSLELAMGGGGKGSADLRPHTCPSMSLVLLFK